MTDYTIETTLPLYWTIAGIVLIILFTFWSYRRTRPPVSNWLRYLLISLRALGLISLWLLVTGFELHWEKNEKARNTIAVLLDSSSSMNFKDRNGWRKEIVDSLFASPYWNTIERKYEITPYTFAGVIQNNPDYQNFSPAGNESNIYAALNFFANQTSEPPDAFVLISDGAINSGQSISEVGRKLNRPVYSILVGDSLPQMDLVVENIYFSDVAYLGEEVEMDAQIVGSGLKNKSTIINLIDSQGQTVATDTITFTTDWTQERVKFKFIPKQSGLQSYQVVATNLSDEINKENNSRMATLRVSERKRSILLVSPLPNPDAAFTSRLLEKDKDTRLEVIMGGKPGGALLRGTNLSSEQINEFDGAIVFLDGKVKGQILDVMRKVAASDIPMVIFSGSQPESRTLALFATRTSSTERTRPGITATPVPSEAHALFTLEGEWFESGTVPPPVELPPFYFKSGQHLAYANKVPVVTVSDYKDKTLIFTGSGYYRWDLSMRSIDASGKDFQALWERILRWLTVKSGENRVKVESLQDLYSGGSDIQLVATVADEGLRPLDNALVSAKIKSGEEELTVELSSIGGGRYLARLKPWITGKYTFSAQIDVNGDSFVRDGSFYVDKFDLESLEYRSRPDRLHSLSDVTGGEMLLPDNISELVNLLPEKEGVETITGQFIPFGKWSALILTVLLFSIEWLIRTRLGML